MNFFWFVRLAYRCILTLRMFGQTRFKQTLHLIVFLMLSVFVSGDRYTSPGDPKIIDESDCVTTMRNASA